MSIGDPGLLSLPSANSLKLTLARIGVVTGFVGNCFISGDTPNANDEGDVPNVAAETTGTPPNIMGATGVNGGDTLFGRFFPARFNLNVDFLIDP